MDNSSSTHPSESTVSLANSVISTAPLVRPKKDFEAAFAGLQATYGIAGGIPAPPDKKSSALKQKSSPKASTSKSIAASTLPITTSSEDAIPPSEAKAKPRDSKPKSVFSLFSTKSTSYLQVI